MTQSCAEILTRITNRNRQRGLLMTGAAVALSLAAPAFAQTDPAAATQAAQANAEATPTSDSRPANSTGEIVVTGSRIRRAPIIDQPVQELGSTQIEKRGYTNLGTALLELPGFSTPTNSQIGGQGSFSAGQTYVNLYNLGSQRTLSLVNGHRFVSSATSSIFGPVAGSPVDYAQIPVNLVDRVEVVSVGGAPVYGADAIAGTVNTILKKDFNGVDLQAQSGISQRGNGQDFTFQGLFGHNFAEGRGNVTLSLQYDRQYGIPGSDIPYLGGNAPFFGTAASSSAAYAQQLYFGGRRYTGFPNTGFPLTSDGIPISGIMPSAAVTNAAGQALFFNNSGQLTPFVNGQQTGSSIYQAGGSGFAIGDTNNFLNSSRRFQSVALAHYDFSDHLKFSGEAWFGRNDSSNLRAQPFYNTALFNSAGATNGNLILNTANPYLSAGDRATIVSALTAAGADPTTFYLARANTDLATGSFRSRSDLYRFVGGLNGDFNVGNHNFNYEVSAVYGHSKTTTTTNEVVNQNYYNALDAVRDANGNITCRPGYTSASIATYSATCSPLDLFGVGQASQAAINYVTALAKPIQNNSQLDVIADIGGSIVTLPGGDVKFSLGYEHRRESVNFDPGTFYRGQDNGDGTRTQYGNSIPIDPVRGAFHTNEFFGELDVPLVSPDLHIPLIHSLDINGAGRHVRNSITQGGFWSYTGGGTYAPVVGITFRGNYTRSFRAPAITEAFAPTGQVFDTANDPCDRRYINGGPDPARRANNCAAAGIAQPFTSNVADYTAKGTFGGNSNLQNEVANSWTAGGVLQPRFIPGLSISADYVSIDISNEIASLNLTNLMNACYDATDYPSNPFCGTFTRDADHQVTSFAEGNYNIGIESFRGLQAVFGYVLPLRRVGLPDSFGQLGLTVNYLHTFRHYYQVGSGDKQFTLGSVQEPADNFTANLNYDNQGFNVLWQTIFYGPTVIDPNVPITNYQYPRVKKYFMFNASIGKEFEHFSLRLTINNVLDKHIPFPYALSTATSNATVRYYDALLGRSFRITAGVKF